MIKKLYRVVLLAISLAVLQSAAMAGSIDIYAGVGSGLIVNTNDDGNNFRGVPLTLFAGLGGFTDNNFYVAGEIIGNLNTASLDNTGLKQTYSWGVSVLPGLVLSEQVLGFLRIGGTRTHFGSDNKTAAELGVGLQTRLSRDWDIRGEYDYIQYNSSLKTDQFAIGFVYKFM